MRSFRFILNPHSGKNRRRPHLANQLRAWIRFHAIDASVVLTERGGHATELAHQAIRDEVDCVVAVGGDGTMNEVARALVNTNTSLGLISCGSGNGLARHLGIYGNLEHMLTILREGRIATIDTGMMAGRPFFNVAGLGLDAAIAQKFASLTNRGFLGYVRCGLTAYREFSSENVHVRELHSGWEGQARVQILSFANSDQYGNNARIAPRAQTNDGKLDLVAVRQGDFCQNAAAATRLFMSDFTRSQLVTHRSAEKFSVTRTNPGWAHVDGEPFETPANFDVETLPNSLRIVVGADSTVFWKRNN